MEGVANYVLALVLILSVMNQQESLSATQHVVGGSQGWDESTDFSSWASSQTFKLGDQLVFKYTQGLHSVVELADESAYKSCKIGTALDSKNTGSDMVKLNKEGTRYFACGTPGHCAQGMKVKITTTSGSSSSSSPTTTATTSAASVLPNFAAPFIISGAAALLVILVVRPHQIIA